MCSPQHPFFLQVHPPPSSSPSFRARSPAILLSHFQGTPCPPSYSPFSVTLSPTSSSCFLGVLLPITLFFLFQAIPPHGPLLPFSGCILFCQCAPPAILFSYFLGASPLCPLLTFLRCSLPQSSSYFFQGASSSATALPPAILFLLVRVVPTCCPFLFWGASPTVFSLFWGAPTILFSLLVGASRPSSALPTPSSSCFFWVLSLLSSSYFFGVLPTAILFSLFFEVLPPAVLFLLLSGCLLICSCTPPCHPLPTCSCHSSLLSFYFSVCFPPLSSSYFFGVPLDPLECFPPPTSSCFFWAAPSTILFYFQSTPSSILFSHFQGCSPPLSSSHFFGVLSPNQPLLTFSECLLTPQGSPLCHPILLGAPLGSLHCHCSLFSDAY